LHWHADKERQAENLVLTRIKENILTVENVKQLVLWLTKNYFKV